MARDATCLEPPTAAATADAVAVAAGGIAGVAMAAAAGVGVADGADGGEWWCNTVVLSKKETTPCRISECEGVVMLLLST